MNIRLAQYRTVLTSGDLACNNGRAASPPGSVCALLMFGHVAENNSFDISVFLSH